jgi:hypothetical protein
MNKNDQPVVTRNWRSSFTAALGMMFIDYVVSPECTYFTIQQGESGVMSQANHDPDFDSTNDIIKWPGVQVISSYVAPGMIKGCYTIDTLLLSTLQCFYTDSNCMEKMFYYIDESYL